MLINQKAPDFTATAVMKDNTINDQFNLYQYLDNRIGVLFFYPLDFTFVCPSEILAFNQHVSAFEKKGAKVIGVSVDSEYTHLAWKNTDVKKGGIGPVQFPLVSDLTKSIAKDYGVLFNDAVAFRATFLIDQEGIIQHMLVNNLPLGRNIEESLRMVDALTYHQKYGEVCPANWTDGKKGMIATPDGVATYLSEHESNFKNV